MEISKTLSDDDDNVRGFTKLTTQITDQEQK